VEQGPPSASTVELPIHISASANGAVTGKACSTIAGSCIMDTPAWATHRPCTFTEGAMPLSSLTATAPSPLPGEGSAGAMSDMMPDMMSNTIAQAGTGMQGDEGHAVAWMSTPKPRSKYVPTGMPGMLGSTLANSACKSFRASLASLKSSPNARSASISGFPSIAM